MSVEFPLRRVGGNALSILTSDVMNRATSLVVYALVARRLGAQAFGQLTLAFALFYAFQVFAVGGLKTLIIRQVAQDPQQTRLFLINGCAIVALSSCASFTVLFGVVRLMHYPSATTSVALLLSFGLLPYTVSAVCEGIFQAWERMRYIAYVNLPANAAKIGGAFVLLSRNGGLHAVVVVLVSAVAAVAVIEAWIVLRRFPSAPASFDLSFSLAAIRSAATFLGIDGTLAVMSSVNILLLSRLTTETEVGLYGAATQVMVPLLLVYQSIAQSIFPVMCRNIEAGFERLKRIAVRAIELLLALALPAVAAIFLAGDRMLSILYKDPAFLQAFPALRIIVWVLILQVFTSVLGQVLVASHRERVTLRIVVVDTLVNVLAGWPLIRIFGLRGAAVALLLTRAVDCWQHYVPVSRLLSGIPLAKLVWKPVVAAACMAAYLAVSHAL